MDNAKICKLFFSGYGENIEGLISKSLSLFLPPSLPPPLSLSPSLPLLVPKSLYLTVPQSLRLYVSGYPCPPSHRVPLS
jgi:hypothetical protein